MFWPFARSDIPLPQVDLRHHELASNTDAALPLAQEFAMPVAFEGYVWREDAAVLRSADLVPNRVVYPLNTIAQLGSFPLAEVALHYAVFNAPPDAPADWVAQSGTMGFVSSGNPRVVRAALPNNMIFIPDFAPADYWLKRLPPFQMPKRIGASHMYHLLRHEDCHLRQYMSATQRLFELNPALAEQTAPFRDPPDRGNRISPWDWHHGAVEDEPICSPMIDFCVPSFSRFIDLDGSGQYDRIVCPDLNGQAGHQLVREDAIVVGAECDGGAQILTRDLDGDGHLGSVFDERDLENLDIDLDGLPNWREANFAAAEIEGPLLDTWNTLEAECIAGTIQLEQDCIINPDCVLNLHDETDWSDRSVRFQALEEP